MSPSNIQQYFDVDKFNALINELPKPNLILLGFSKTLHPNFFEISTVLSDELSSMTVMLLKPLVFKFEIVS